LGWEKSRQRKKRKRVATKGAKKPEENQEKLSLWHLRGFYGIL
jgi:hypothetical protein